MNESKQKYAWIKLEEPVSTIGNRWACYPILGDSEYICNHAGSSKLVANFGLPYFISESCNMSDATCEMRYEYFQKYGETEKIMEKIWNSDAPLVKIVHDAIEIIRKAGPRIEVHEALRTALDIWTI